LHALQTSLFQREYLDNQVARNEPEGFVFLAFHISTRASLLHPSMFYDFFSVPAATSE